MAKLKKRTLILGGILLAAAWAASKLAPKGGDCNCAGGA